MTRMQQQTERLEFVRKRILQIRTAILELPVGVTSINREGFSAGYNVEMANKELVFLEDEEKRLTGTKKPAIRPVDLSRC